MSEQVNNNLYEHITGYWDWSINQPDRYYNPVLKNALGYSPHDFPDEVEHWRKYIFPGDFYDFLCAFEKHVKSGGVVPFAHDLRFYHKDGSTVYIFVTGRVMSFTPEGVPQQIFGSHINTTAQKQAQRELTRTRDFLERTSQVAMVGGWELDMETGKVIWSKVTRQIFGVDDDFEPVSGSSALFFKEGEDRDKILNAYHNAVEKGESYDLELQIVNTAGEVRWTRTVGQPEFENNKCIRLYGMFQDITARKMQDDALRQKQIQLETFIRHTPVAIAMLDRDLNYINVSELWMASYNIDINTLAGRNHFDVFPEIPDIWRVYLARCLRGEVIKKEEDFFYRMDGRLEWLRWEIRPWYESPGVVGGVILFTELITDKKNNREALIKAKEEAEKAASTKTRFLSVMSHEIRTPMNGVIGFTNLLLENSPRDDQREALNVLKFSAQNLLVIINDVLDLNKIDAGKIKLEKTPFDLKELLENVCRSQDQDAKEKNLKLIVQFDPELPHWFSSDPVRIGQVITNLVSNAIKFTPTGKINISTALIADNESSMTIGFAVSDTGIGIPEDKQEYIFEMFNQAETDTTRIYGGTGLGLTISRRILELMGSTIQLKSTPGKGSIFYFDLELQKGKQPTEPVNLTFGNTKPSNLKGVKVLIADDNPVNLLVAKRFLQNWQADYDVAENGQIALEKVQANEYDLILMDIKMPVMDGYEATVAIRKLEGKRFKNIPIIALSASVMSDAHDEMIKSGMNDYVSKPFNPDELFERIRQYTQQDFLLAPGSDH